MSKRPKIDGYAVWNTTCVLRALQAFERKEAELGNISQATAAAINVYDALAEKRVTYRTVAKWRSVVSRYGGIDKTPENAFGAKRECPRKERPIRALLRIIQRVTDEILDNVKRTGCDDSLLADLTALDLDISHCVDVVLHRSPIHSRAIAHLESIGKAGRYLETMAIHRFCRYVPANETSASLERLLARLKRVAANQPRKAA